MNRYEVELFDRSANIVAEEMIPLGRGVGFLCASELVAYFPRCIHAIMANEKEEIEGVRYEM